MNARPVFASIRSEIRREEESDPEPETRFFEPWYAWQRRHWARERQLTDLRESEALTRNPSDPCPPASAGLAPFLLWAQRNGKKARWKK